jgi:DNA-binding PadR family transcriptional regulator
MLMEGWVSGEWGVSETKRRVRFYSLTKDGLKQLKQEIAEYQQVSAAIQGILRTA